MSGKWFPLWGWRWRSLRDQFSHASAEGNHRGLGDGHGCLPGLLGESQHIALGGDTLMSSQLAPTNSVPLLGTGGLVPWSGPPHWRILPQPFSHLCSSRPGWGRPSPWGWLATRASPAPWSGSSWHWCFPALAMHWFSPWHSSIMYSSCCQLGSSLGVSTYSPQYTCSAMSRISQSVDPKRTLTEGCTGPLLHLYQFVELGGTF